MQEVQKSLAREGSSEFIFGITPFASSQLSDVFQENNFIWDTT